MGSKEEEFLKRLQATFKIEAEEHLAAISSGLLELESAPAPEKSGEIIGSIYREAHSLKGAARSVNMTEIESICQSLENVLSAWKRGQISSSPGLFDTLLHVSDTMRQFFSPANGPDSKPDKQQAEELVRQLICLQEEGRNGQPRAENAAAQSFTQAPEPPPQPVDRQPPEPKSQRTESAAVAAEQSAIAETVRISTNKLNSLLLQTEEMVSAKLTMSQRAADLREVVTLLNQWSKEWAKVYPEVRSLRRSLAKAQDHNGRGQIDSQSLKVLDFLDWNHARIKSIENKVAALTRSAEQDHRTASGMVDNLLNDMKKVLMLPISTLLEIFPKMVRDLSRSLGKEVELVINGGEIEIDRRILEEMKDPLIHLIRNCVDHGIEKPEERVRDHKPARGTVALSLSQVEGNKVEILIEDDGAGIDVEKVKKTAVANGIVSQAEANELSDDDALSLIFASDLSTSPVITDLSGRGLGLAIVQEKLDKIGGSVSVTTDPPRGTSFRILLPLTLATFRGILVRATGQDFVIPTANVEQVARVRRDEIKTVGNRRTIVLNGRTVPLVELAEILELVQDNHHDSAPDLITVLALGLGEKQIAFAVDAMVNEQEVLVKSLGRQLVRVRNVASATVLGSGKVVPILNVPDLMKSAVKSPATRAVPAAPEGEAERIKSILIAEDSITSRTLLKNIVEAAGYRVKTVVDGLEAFAALRTESFDLLVTDIEMPRMDGFELTARIRSDAELSGLPVVLVTSRSAREDRERGIDVGANAYIIKGSFDQSNLLEAIRRLL